MAYDDFEQGERVRAWIRENGLAVVAGVVLGLVVIFGYRFWTAKNSRAQLQAASQYQAIQGFVASGKNDEADSLTDSLLKNHSKSAYAVFASMLQGQRQLDAGNADQAVKSLRWAVDHTKSGPLKITSQTRLARVLLAADKPEAALAELKDIPSDSFTSSVAELRGDAEARLGHVDEARTAYQTALASYSEGTPGHHLVDMKLQGLTILNADAPAAPTPDTNDSTDSQGA